MTQLSPMNSNHTVSIWVFGGRWGRLAVEVDVTLSSLGLEVGSSATQAKRLCAVGHSGAVCVSLMRQRVAGYRGAFVELRQRAPRHKASYILYGCVRKTGIKVQES
jgi:hypothetical protein